MLLLDPVGNHICGGLSDGVIYKGPKLVIWGVKWRHHI